MKETFLTNNIACPVQKKCDKDDKVQWERKYIILRYLLGWTPDKYPLTDKYIFPSKPSTRKKLIFPSYKLVVVVDLTASNRTYFLKRTREQWNYLCTWTTVLAIKYWRKQQPCASLYVLRQARVVSIGGKGKPDSTTTSPQHFKQFNSH